MRTLLLLLLVLFVLKAFAQERENRAVRLSFLQSSEKLKEFTGWSYNERQAEWVSNKNVIDDKFCPKEWKSHNYQNINNIQISTFRWKEELMYAVVFERNYGWYLYPNIEEDWQEFEETIALVFDSSKYTQILSVLSQDSTKILSITPTCAIIMKSASLLQGIDYNDRFLLMQIENFLETKNSEPQWCFLLSLQNLRAGKRVRFKVPEPCFKKSFLEKSYFEVDLSYFLKLFNF